MADGMLEVLDDISGEGNRRFRLGLRDGAAVEAVVYGGDALCISSQVGCAVACPFCASGARGFGRNLELDELVGQVMTVRGLVNGIVRVTVSGIGEPLHNHQRVVAFTEWARTVGLPVSLTTSGGPLARLRPWLELHPHRGLTISVHAGTEAVRAQMVPHGPSLTALFGVLGQTVPGLGRGRRRKVALAYLLMAGINDHEAEIDAFVERVRSLRLKLHLYAFNPVPTNDLEPASEARYQQIAARLRGDGFDVRRSSQARRRANGGCGTLVAARSASSPNALPVLQ
ncbi:MAG: radical SAM protein [Myxococcales bacterium FL481]|nr:MAG: radical SAM protein [Myxococcales bacterium FL481]